MQTNVIDLSQLSFSLQQELIDFYQFLIEKQAKNKITVPNKVKPILQSEIQSETGFSMLKSNRPTVPADFDPACLLKP